MNAGDFLSYREAAKIADCAIGTVQRAAKSGKLKYCREKGFRRADVVSWSYARFDEHHDSLKEFKFDVDTSGHRVLRHKWTGGIYAIVMPDDPDWWLSVRGGLKASVAAWPNPTKLGALMFTARELVR